MQRLIRIYSVCYEKTIKSIPIKVPDETLTDPDQTLQNAAHGQDLQCFQRENFHLSSEKKKKTPSEADIKRKHSMIIMPTRTRHCIMQRMMRPHTVSGANTYQKT